MVGEVVQTVEAVGGMSNGMLLGIIGALVAAITTLGQVVSVQVQRRSNPLNGTLSNLDRSLGELNATLAKVDIRSERSDLVLERHTERLIIMSTAVTQLAANGAQQTRALVDLKPALDASLTGCAARITGHCDERSKAILEAVGLVG